MEKRLTLKNRTAIVVGGSGSIGSATISSLLRQGVKVAYTFNANEDSARSLQANFAKQGYETFIFRLDVNDHSKIEKTIHAATARLGGLNYFVYCAGRAKIESIADTSLDSWNEMLSLNLIGAFLTLRSSLDIMAESASGSCVAVSSISALRPRTNQIAYSSSKLGLIQTVRSFAQEYAPMGIRVNAILPGLISTKLVHNLDPLFIENAIQQTPMGRLGKASEVAEAISFLLSDSASYITGQSLCVDGGRVMV